MEALRLDLHPFEGDLAETRKKIDDIKKVAIALLGDHLVLQEEETMRRDVKKLLIDPKEVPTIQHPLKPLEEEQEEVYSQIAILRDTMRACLRRLKILDPKAPELDDQLIKTIADL
ncbi:hypothetical protein JW752_00380 [Candidatus Peregrinibacteria bacterium]|nr:hypothetical protein [Candidatus Peregrinibacteria bacterium]